jgi:hypothetical protein
MEVHNHPHRSTHKKKWTETLLEFLMLFLAVFLGFIAENVREHSVEHKREKQFAGQLLSDLRKDSVFFRKRKEAFDTIFAKSWMRELFAQQQHPSDLEVIRQFLKGFWSFDVSLTNTTFTQMKTSGSLRFIRNTSLTGELQRYYDVLSERVITQSAISRSFFDDYVMSWYVKHVRTQDLDDLGDSILNHKTAIIARTDETDQEILNITNTYRLLTLSVHDRIYKPATKQADTLISMLKKEYHLK